MSSILATVRALTLALVPDDLAEIWYREAASSSTLAHLEEAAAEALSGPDRERVERALAELRAAAEEIFAARVREEIYEEAAAEGFIVDLRWTAFRADGLPELLSPSEREHIVALENESLAHPA